MKFAQIDMDAIAELGAVFAGVLTIIRALL